MDGSRFESDLAASRDRVLAHPIYAAVDTRARLRCFMEHHVFAVWDFMSLLKSLQRELTCVSTPWLPTPLRAARRLVNEIVLVEESDLDPAGGSASHFELYLEAMDEIGASTGPIRALCDRLRAGQPIDLALAAGDGPEPARQFVRHTLGLVEHGTPEEVAAAFTYGREDIIPDMFRRFLADGAAKEYPRLAYYLARHVEVDGDEHGPAAHRLVALLCGDDPACWHRANAAARSAIEARIALWDAVVTALPGA